MDDKRLADGWIKLAELNSNLERGVRLDSKRAQEQVLFRGKKSSEQSTSLLGEGSLYFFGHVMSHHL